MAAFAKEDARSQIAEELSRRTGRNITVSILNDYTATTKMTARFPASYVRDFCEITGDDSLQRYLLGARLLDLISVGENELNSQLSRVAKETVLRRLVSSGPIAGR